MIGSWYGWRANIILRQQLAAIEAQQPKTEYSEYEKDIATIVKYELEMTEAISKGHKAADNDKFKEYRETLKQLRAKHNLKRKAQ